MKPINLNSKEFFDKLYLEIAKDLNLTNPFTIPKIEKVCINTGVGKLSSNSLKEEVGKHITTLTGQKAKAIKSNIAISEFNLRKGQITAYKATLRGQKISSFIFNLVYLSLPRTRDFKALNDSTFSKNFKSYNLGIEDCSIFPQISPSTKFGIQINIVFKSPDKKNKLLLEKIGFPFPKNNPKSQAKKTN